MISIPVESGDEADASFQYLTGILEQKVLETDEF